MDWKIPTPAEVYDESYLTWLRETGFWAGKPIWELVEPWAADDPDFVVLIDDTNSITVGEIRESALRVAGALAESGVVAGDRILVQLPNVVEAAVVFYAIARLGAVMVPVQVVMRNYEVESLLRRTEAVAIICVDEFNGFDHGAMARTMVDLVPSLQHLFVLGAKREGVRSFAELLDGPVFDGPVPSADDPIVVVFTSGTTSLPKGCVHTSNTYMNHGSCTAVLVGIEPGDVFFMPSPVMHNTGLGLGILMPFIFRLRSVLQAKWDAPKALELIGRHRISMLAGAAPFATMLLRAYDPEKHDVSSFRAMAFGGAPVPIGIIKELNATFDCKSLALYGSTEGGTVTGTRMDDAMERAATTDGRANEGVDLIISDDHGDAVATGEEGEIRFSTPARFLCYWQDNDLTAKVLDNNGRFCSGDLGRMDSDGYIRVTGRVSDMIIRGGMNISALEVENILRQHPAVVDVALVSMPDERLGEKACAFVVSRDDSLDVAEFSRFLTGLGVAKNKYPERVVLVDQLPLNPTGKVLKTELRFRIREMLAEEAESA